MEISSILVGLILFSVALFFVSAPFRQKRQKTENPSKVHTQQEGQREVVLVGLRDLDFDFKTGKVSEEDYKPLRAQLMVEAAQYIAAETKGDDQLEEMIRAQRTGKQKGLRCQECQAPIQASQGFCPKCGSTVNHELCPSCGKKIQAGDLFCSSCGNKLQIPMEAAAQS
jgi:predicted nucleic acid-binding Zn ribbon protein